MKNKILFGTMLALLLVGSVSFADDDADKKRLLEEYDKMQEEKAKEQPVALKVLEIIAPIISALIIFSGNMIGCYSNRTTQVEKNRIEEKKCR